MASRTDLGGAECPIARSLDDVGEWWSMLILRDAFAGYTRFDEFQRNLGIAPNMLTRRLRTLVDAGLLERRRYQDRPARHEYVLTTRGREFLPVLVTLAGFGDRHVPADSRSIQLVNRASGEPVDAVLVDRRTGLPLDELDVGFAAGPAASAEMREHYALSSKD